MQSNARKNGLNTVLLTFTLHSYFLCIGFRLLSDNFLYLYALCAGMVVQRGGNADVKGIMSGSDPMKYN